jgi:hypothetical protein
MNSRDNHIQVTTAVTGPIMPSVVMSARMSESRKGYDRCGASFNYTWRSHGLICETHRDFRMRIGRHSHPQIECVIILSLAAIAGVLPQALPTLEMDEYTTNRRVPALATHLPKLCLL